MKILIIGGTRFVGRHLVEAALARGHTLTLFNRGQHGPELFPQVEKIRGDRTVDLSALTDRKWDAVIDTCGYAPRIVRLSAEYLAQSVERYIFISTISVYAEPLSPNFDESAPLDQLKAESSEEVTNESYGPLKVLCERAVEQALPDRALIIRPGYIVGPHDHTDRFTYWPRRVAQGGEVLAPGNPEQPMQFVDGRDLAGWAIRMIEARQIGIYHVTGPRDPLSMKMLLDECQRVTKSDANFTWINEEFLAGAGVTLSSDFPIWSPAADAAFLTADCSKAISAGLTYRALADTIRDTLAWDATRAIGIEHRAGLKSDRERQLLQAWQARPAAHDKGITHAP